MIKSSAILSGIFAATLLAMLSCLSPHDPSAYMDEESVSHDSEKTELFVRKEYQDSMDKLKQQNSEVEYESHVFTVESDEGGFGYNILKDGKLYIHQTSIPSVQGVKGFSTHEKAMRAAEFVIYKLQNGVVPPSVSGRELDSLGVL